MKSLFWLTIGTFFFGLLTMLAIVNLLQGDVWLAAFNMFAAGTNLFSASLHYQNLAKLLKRLEV